MKSYSFPWRSQHHPASMPFVAEETTKSYSYPRRSEHHQGSTPFSTAETTKSYSFPRRLQHHPGKYMHQLSCPPLYYAHASPYLDTNLPFMLISCPQRLQRGPILVSTWLCRRLGLGLSEVSTCLSVNIIKQSAAGVSLSCLSQYLKKETMPSCKHTAQDINN